MGPTKTAQIDIKIESITQENWGDKLRYTAVLQILVHASAAVRMYSQVAMSCVRKECTIHANVVFEI